MNKALVVGVNQYAKQTGLNGCLNDIADVKKALIDHGVVQAIHVTELADSQATKQAILDALTALVGQLGSGDCGYFHFSGHGVRMATTDPQEPDGMDEVICPYEFEWTDATAIRDNELLDALAGLRLDARMVLVFDSCHSGDMSRFVAAPGTLPRTLPVPSGVRATTGPTRLGFRVAGRAPNIAFASAVSPWQVAADTAFNGRANGAFTYSFLKQSNSSAAGTSIDDLVAAVEPQLRPFEMTPVAETGAAPYYPAPTARAPAPILSVMRSPVPSRTGSIAYEQTFHALLLGQDIAVSVRITAANGELTSYVTARFMGETLTSPPIATNRNLSLPIALGYFGVRLVYSVSSWQFAPGAIQFVLGLDVTSDLPFVPRVHVARVPVTINPAMRDRGLVAAPVASPADLVALLTLQRLSSREPAAPQPAGGDAPVITGFRDPTLEVFDSGKASWGPNWRENRAIHTFAGRPRPDGIVRHHVEIGPQRGNGNVYVVGWLSAQDSDFDFILHMGNDFFGGWGDIDWRVVGYYANIQPFPREAVPSPAPTPRTRTNGEAQLHPATSGNGRAEPPLSLTGHD
jgi:hypothetical protein